MGRRAGEDQRLVRTAGSGRFSAREATTIADTAAGPIVDPAVIGAVSGRAQPGPTRTTKPSATRPISSTISAMTTGQRRNSELP